METEYERRARMAKRGERIRAALRASNAILLGGFAAEQFAHGFYFGSFCCAFGAATWLFGVK